jgi:hypothetical protein
MYLRISYKKKKYEEKKNFWAILKTLMKGVGSEVTVDPELDPDPLVRGTVRGS